MVDALHATPRQGTSQRHRSQPGRLPGQHVVLSAREEIRGVDARSFALHRSSKFLPLTARMDDEARRIPSIFRPEASFQPKKMDSSWQENGWGGLQPAVTTPRPGRGPVSFAGPGLKPSQTTTKDGASSGERGHRHTRKQPAALMDRLSARDTVRPCAASTVQGLLAPYVKSPRLRASAKRGESMDDSVRKYATTTVNLLLTPLVESRKPSLCTHLGILLIGSLRTLCPGP